MKKIFAFAFMALLASSQVFAQDEQKPKKTFVDVFQVSVKGGVSLPFASSIYQSSHGLTQQYNLDMCVNPEFDFTVAAKLGNHVSLGLGYMDAGTWFAKQGMKGLETPVIIAGEEYVNTDMYPTRYGTYDCFYGQLGVSFAKWSKYQRVRPILYGRVGVSRNKDYTLLSRPVYGAGSEFESMQQFQNDILDQFIYHDTAVDNAWSIYTAIGLMVSINVWDKLSVLVDVKENQFVFTANQKVNGYYYTKDSGVVHAESLQMNGWFAASLGLAWNF